MRDLKPGDRVKITGPWSRTTHGNMLIGKFAIVQAVVKSHILPIELLIDGWGSTLYWCRENLRALPRGK